MRGSEGKTARPGIGQRLGEIKLRRSRCAVLQKLRASCVACVASFVARVGSSQSSSPPLTDGTVRSGVATAHQFLGSVRQLFEASSAFVRSALRKSCVASCVACVASFVARVGSSYVTYTLTEQSCLFIPQGHVHCVYSLPGTLAISLDVAADTELLRGVANGLMKK
jgi:hypothetical protein